MNKKKSYIVAIVLTIIIACSTLGQVFAVREIYTGNETYSILKEKFEWEHRSDTKLEDYLTKGLIFENLKEKDGCDMSLSIPATDSFGGVIEAFTTMLESEDEAIRLFLDFVEEQKSFTKYYAGREIEVIRNIDEGSKIIMHPITKKYTDSNKSISN